MPNSKEDLPSGGWIELRDPNWLRAKDRNALMRQVDSADESLSKMDQGLHAINTLAALMIADWTLPYDPDPADDGTERTWTLPKHDLSMLDELTAADSNRLQELLEPAQRVLMPTKPSPDQHTDPQSPSGPASA